MLLVSPYRDVYKLLTVSEINVGCFIFGVGLEVSNKGLHTLKGNKIYHYNFSTYY